MLDKARKTIKKFNMLKKGDAVVVCVSGGVDSVVLLHVLTGLAEEYRLSVIAVHLNHSLRGKESDRDEAFVNMLAKKMGVRFVSKKVHVRSLAKGGESLQDAARDARLRFFEETAGRYKAQRIATGHNMDDQAETMIMRLLKGAGLAGLGGIPPKRGKYIRPLIDIGRGEIEEYAAANGLKFVQDSSNRSTKYLRNRIRLELMPMLESYNPRLKCDMARLARILARDEDYLRCRADGSYKRIRVRQGKNIIAMDLKKLKGLHDSVKARVFFMALEELLGSSKGFYSYHVEDFLELLRSNAPNISIDIPHGLTIHREYDRVTVERSQKSEVRSQKRDEGILFEQELKINGKTNIIADNGLEIAIFKSQILNLKSQISYLHPTSQSFACFDYDRLKMPLIVRNFRPGDRFMPFGMKGHKKLKDLFIEKKIARRKRGLIPIIVSGNDIIWVTGIRQAEYGKIWPDTKKVLKIEIKVASDKIQDAGKDT